MKVVDEEVFAYEDFQFKSCFFLLTRIGGTTNNPKPT